MTPLLDRPGAVVPIAPATVEDTGLDPELIAELTLKVLHRSAGLSGGELAKRLGLHYNVVHPSLERLRAQQLCEIIGGPMLGGSSLRHRLTEKGQDRAARALDYNQYSGVAPVPIAQYREYLAGVHRHDLVPVTPDDVRRAFSALVIDDEVLDEIGAAVNARHSVFIYGPPGNGKSVIGQTIRSLLGGSIAVPHAIEVGGQIIRFFDPSVHEPVEAAAVDTEHDSAPQAHEPPQYDRRWVACRRPMVIVGGELTLQALALAYNPRSGTYRAPVQALANGGALILDDFGRQQCPPRDLLNCWMVPLESRVEYLTLESGEKVEMPFHALVIFSTNIRPADLVDEAFLRRIRYKIYAKSPSPRDFARIFERCCEDRGIPFDPQHVEHLLDGVYRPRRIELRGCHPRDLIEQALALASYRGQPRRLTQELLDAACASYFLVDEEDQQQRPR